MVMVARVVGGTAAAIALLLAAPSPAGAWRSLSSVSGTASPAPSSAADPTAPLLAAVALTAWLLIGWLLLTAALCLLEQLPGAAGRAAAAVVERIAPAALRRLVAVGLGVAVASGPVAPALAAPPAPAPAATSAPLDWPGTTPAELDWPAAPSPTAAMPPTRAPGPASGAASALGAPVAREAPVGAVVVRPGDTLWGLAETALRGAGTPEPAAAQVATAWPAWWAANRDVIGEEPDLLLPGTVLRPPPGAAPPT